MASFGSLNNLDQITEHVRLQFDQKNAARERALAHCREAIRSSANSIRAVHRREFESAAQLLDQARGAVTSAVTVLRGFGDILHAGFVHDAQKEYVEASVVFALLSGQALPDPDQLGVEYPAYMNGLSEAVGELRRFLLDDLRRGSVAEGESLLQAMDDIYSVLVTMDYPDAVTGGLRRSTDVARGILEKTRGDLTVAMRQAVLETLLRDVANRLNGEQS